MKHFLVLLLFISLICPVFASDFMLQNKTEGQFFEALKGDATYTEMVLPQYEIISSDEDRIIEYMDVINLENSFVPKFNSNIKSSLDSFGEKYQNPILNPLLLKAKSPFCSTSGQLGAVLAEWYPQLSMR